MKPLIVVAAFSRKNSLRRLLNSLNKAKFSHRVTLWVSLDGGATSEVVALANSFNFRHGDYKVINRKENLGLRKHILWCGDQTSVSGSVIVLEDDLVVDPHFYSYAKSALAFYENEKSIAGVALYSPRYNENAFMPFEPSYNGQTTFLMGTPCSSGQAWSSAQWRRFKSWYKEFGNKERVDRCKNLPQTVRSWPESSWKKYFALFMVENNLFFVYPYQGYSSNCSDTGGSHISTATSIHQIPIGEPDRECESFLFRPFVEHNVKYDSFMERTADWGEKVLGLKANSLTIDLYSTKSSDLILEKEFCVSTRKSNLASNFFSLSFRPLEMNLFYPSESHSEGGIALFYSKDVPFKKKPDFVRFYEYWSFYPLWSTRIFKVFSRAILEKIVSKILGVLS